MFRFALDVRSRTKVTDGNSTIRRVGGALNISTTKSTDIKCWDVRLLREVKRPSLLIPPIWSGMR